MDDKKIKADREIEIRGTALKVAVIFERFMMMIIYFSNAEQYKVEDSPNLKVKNLTFGGKIIRVKGLLKEYHPDLLIKYSQLFKDLENFRDFRNRIAHCAFDWKQGIDTFEVLDVVIGKNNFQYFAPFQYNVRETYETTANALGDMSPPLSNLLDDIQHRLKKLHPLLYAQLTRDENVDPSK